MTMNHATGCNFSLDHYESFLSRYQESGYRFILFAEKPQSEKHIYLRHDVDRSLEKAEAMAAREATLGIRATYFVRLHSRFYNCYSYPGYQQLRKIMDSGHAIGLHTEFYDMAKIFGVDAVATFEKECRILEEIIERRITVFSPHRTTGSTGDDEIRAQMKIIRQKTSLLCTFDREFFEDCRYVSDSSGIWREGCPCGYVGKFPRMQILAHPMWWFREHIELEDSFL